MVKDNFVSYKLWKVDQIFQAIPEHDWDLVREAREKGKKPWHTWPKNEILFHYPLTFPKLPKAFPKTFSTEMKSTECPAKE